MKTRNLLIRISILNIVVLLGCSTKEKSIIELIDIEEWNKTTMHSINETLHVKDTLLKYYSDLPADLDEDRNVYEIIEDYYKSINSALQLRNDQVKVLLNNKVIKKEDSLHIVEFNGTTEDGIYKTASVYINNEIRYFYQYNTDSGSYSEQEIKYAGNHSVDFKKDVNNLPHAYYIYEPTIIICTRIIKEDNNSLAYETCYIQLM